MTAAVELVERGVHTEVYERKSYVGGRARSFKDKETGEIIDNGQHLLFGAYKNFLALLEKLGSTNKLLYRKGIDVPFIEKNGIVSKFNSLSLSGKAGILLGLLELKGIDFREKIRAIDFALNLSRNRVSVENRTALQLMKENEQSDNIIYRLWKPICLAAINLGVEEADASLFAEVLKKGFLSDSSSARIIIPKAPLSSLFENFANFLEERGGSLHLDSPIKKLKIRDSELQWIETEKDRIEADYYIFAGDIPSLKALLPTELSNFDFKYLNDFEFSTIISVYLWFDKAFKGETYYSVLNSTIQWIFNRRKLVEAPPEVTKEYPGQLTITISGAGKLNERKSESLIKDILYDLHLLLPRFAKAKLLRAKLIRDKFATFKASPSINQIRPRNVSPVKNLFLAGDWTDTGLPATLESAAKSGKVAADLILKKNY